MNSIHCHGVSNTQGADPPHTGRWLGRDIRGPGVLPAALGSGFQVIEEGLNGRTSVILSSHLDGIHVAPEGHAKLGRAVAATAREPLA